MRGLLFFLAFVLFNVGAALWEVDNIAWGFVFAGAALFCGYLAVTIKRPDL